jgi:hypothetical protein
MPQLRRYLDLRGPTLALAGGDDVDDDDEEDDDDAEDDDGAEDGSIDCCCKKVLPKVVWLPLLSQLLAGRVERRLLLV